MSLSWSLARLDRVSLEVLVESADVCARGAILRATLALELWARARRAWTSGTTPFGSPDPPCLEWMPMRALGYHRAHDKLRSVQAAARAELASRRKARSEVRS